MVTQKELNKLYQRLSDLIQKELDGLKEDLMKLVEEDQETHLQHQKVLKVSHLELERRPDRLKEKVTELILRDRQIPPGTQPTYFGEHIMNLKLRVQELETYHPIPETKPLEIPPSPANLRSSETISSPLSMPSLKPTPEERRWSSWMRLRARVRPLSQKSSDD